jgi:hypothetical protein
MYVLVHYKIKNLARDQEAPKMSKALGSKQDTKTRVASRLYRFSFHIQRTFTAAAAAAPPPPPPPQKNIHPRGSRSHLLIQIAQPPTQQYFGPIFPPMLTAPKKTER